MTRPARLGIAALALALAYGGGAATVWVRLRAARVQAAADAGEAADARRRLQAGRALAEAQASHLRVVAAMAEAREQLLRADVQLWQSNFGAAGAALEQGRARLVGAARQGGPALAARVRALEPRLDGLRAQVAALKPAARADLEALVEEVSRLPID